MGWLSFFRLVNLPTVPGDVLVGLAAVAAGASAPAPAPCLAAVAAACALYLFGLADNDIVGAATDGPERPIPAGLISLRAARLARGLCLFAAFAAGAAAALPPAWWIAAALLAATCVAYNRMKRPLLMGLSRGLDVACGAACALGPTGRVSLAALAPALAAVALWTVYITAVTRYSEGEEASPAKRRCVGFLVGALVYLQLGALLALYLWRPSPVLRNLLLGGAALLVLLRLVRRALPKVSAS